MAILDNIFLLTRLDAEQIIITAHYNGVAYLQTLPKSERQKRICKARFATGLEGYPLQFSMEPE